MDKPKFCVGEEVMVRSLYFPEKNTDRIEIVGVKKSSECNFAAGTKEVGVWSYRLAGQDSHTYSRESSLRKIPPEDRTQFDDEIWNPLKETA